MKIEHRIGEDGKYHVYLDDERAWPGFSFTGEMLAARDDGRKTETRRLHKRAKFEVGQLVYVKEKIYAGDGDGNAYYKLDNEPVYIPYNGKIKMRMLWRWKRDRLPGIFMPAEAARRFDRIAEVREERLQEITEADIVREGIDAYIQHALGGAGVNKREAFKHLWNSINPKHPWDSNPWVFAYRFEVIK